MATGVTLSELLDALRGEANMSMFAGHHQATRDNQIHLLNRVQEQLYNAHDWPALTVERDVPLLHGERFYEYPEDLNFERISGAFSKNGTLWYALKYGISVADYNSLGGDETHTNANVMRWRHHADETRQFEVWPVPSEDNTLRFRGVKALKRMVADTDKCILDSVAITMFAAAELLARAKSEDAQLKLQNAQTYVRTLKAQQGAGKSNTFILGGGVGQAKPKRPGIDYIPRGGS